MSNDAYIKLNDESDREVYAIAKDIIFQQLIEEVREEEKRFLETLELSLDKEHSLWYY